MMRNEETGRMEMVWSESESAYKIPVSCHVTRASAYGQTELRSMIQETFEQTPELAERCEAFVAECGLDCGETK